MERQRKKKEKDKIEENKLKVQLLHQREKIKRYRSISELVRRVTSSPVFFPYFRLSRISQQPSTPRYAYKAYSERRGARARARA